MRCSAATNAVFLSLIIFGITSYMYMVWTQHWLPPESHDKSITSTYDRQIFLYNRGYLPNSTVTDPVISWSKIKGNVTTFRKRSRPLIPSGNHHEFLLDTNKYHCWKNESQALCNEKTAEFKEKLLVQLNNIFSDESNILNIKNPYNVHYVGPKEDFRKKPPKQVLCELLDTKLQTLKRSDIDANEPIKSSMPKRAFFENKYFNSCAVIASSGALRQSNLGAFIDSHDVVLRFNNAPTKKFERDVGSKTTVRVINSQVASKREYRFLRSNLYKNVSLVLWDPSNYSGSLEEWLRGPEHNLFPNFMQYRRQEAKPRIFLINPLTIWDVWDFLQRNSPNRLKKHPPSSGFIGLRILLPHCNFVDVIEYIPSTRVSKRCHYFDPNEDPACTFGVWHPLSAEKLLTYHLNEATDYEAFQKGFVRIKGFRNLNC